MAEEEEEEEVDLGEEEEEEVILPEEEMDPNEVIFDELTQEETAEAMLNDVLQQMMTPTTTTTTTTKPTGSRMKPSSILPKPGGATGGPRVNRLQRSYVVRDVVSKYPTEIESTPRDPLPLTNAVSEPLKSFIAVMRSYMGHDPAAFDVEPVMNRLLRSTKADDESDSEHFQRLMAALHTLNGVATSRVDTLQTLIELAQKDLTEDRQHERFTNVIAVKRDKADSEIARDDVSKRDAEYDLVLKRRREDHLGYLSRELEAKEARCRISLLDGFPDRPIDYGRPIVPQKTNFGRRLDYLRTKID
jgi:hypothetical protein